MPTHHVSFLGHFNTIYIHKLNIIKMGAVNVNQLNFIEANGAIQGCTKQRIDPQADSTATESTS